jgi:phosphoribosylglycinamide formyltransferase 2
MVTLAGTQNFNEFELHLRAVLGFPIPEITLERAGASAVVLASGNSTQPSYEGFDKVSALPKTDFRIFGKPSTRPYRRMAVALTYDAVETDTATLIKRAQEAASFIKIIE